MTATDNFEIELNGYKYQVSGPVKIESISPFPSPLRFGDASYDNKINMSSWPIKCTGGIGVENMNEKTDMDRTWWTNCITEYPGHILPPRLATAIDDAPTGVYTFTSPTSHNDPDSQWADEANAYNTNVTNYAYDGVAVNTWSSFLEFNVASMTVNGVAYFVGGDDTADITNINIDLYYSGGWHDFGTEDPTTGSWQYMTGSEQTGVTACRIALYNDDNDFARSVYIYDVRFMTTATSTPTHLANFNGELYVSFANKLEKLASGRAGFDAVATLPGTITALVPSIDSKLYIFLGDSFPYGYMNTSETIAYSDEKGYWAWQFDNKLEWCTTDGTVQYAADPDNATVTESAGGTITDIASQIERFFVGRDAAGSPVSYCATNTILKVQDIDTPEWIDTEVRLPLHPNGGKGACYYNGRIYLSNGLAVKEYYPETGSINEVGLDTRDGLPVEYNGEIVYLLGDSAVKGMFALVDASQTSGNSLSGLYKYHDGVWDCWWIDTANNGAMTEAIVSSAESGYSVYWGVGTKVYYIDIPRGIQNPDKITQSYATAGHLVTPWFDADNATAKKLAKEMLALIASSSATEYVVLKYRVNKATTAMASTWTTINTYNSTAENTVNTETFASGAGVSFYTIQFRLDFVTAGSTSKCDVQELVLWFKKSTGSQNIWSWTIPIFITDDQPWNTTSAVTAMQKFDLLKSAKESDTDILFKYHQADSGYYVSIDEFSGTTQEGTRYDGNFMLRLIES